MGADVADGLPCEETSRLISKWHHAAQGRNPLMTYGRISLHTSITLGPVHQLSRLIEQGPARITPSLKPLIPA
jgi:hypothetical protein